MAKFAIETQSTVRRTYFVELDEMPSLGMDPAEIPEDAFCDIEEWDEEVISIRNM